MPEMDRLGTFSARKMPPASRDHDVDEVPRFIRTGMRMLAYMFAFWETSKRLSLRSSKSASTGRFVAERLHDLLAVHDLLDMALDDAELALLRDEEARGVRAEHLGEEDHAHDAGDDHQAHQTEKYSMMKSTVPSTMMVWYRLGSDHEIIWRRVSMSLV